MGAFRRGGDRGLLRGILSGCVWNGFLLSFVRGEIVPCRFCGGGPDNDGHLFWECPYPSFVHIHESIEFRDLLLRDKSSWPRCLLWHGWLLVLACSGGASPWAATDDDVACARLERLLGSYSENACREWVPSDQFPDSVASSERPEFHDLLLRDKSSWPRCLLWHGGYLHLLALASPWAASVDDVACARLERLLGSYSEGVCREWVPSDQFVDSVASLMFLITLMCGLMVVLFLMSYRVLGLAGVVFTL